MFDKIFSSLWFLDRCLDGTSLFPWIPLIFSLFIGFLIHQCTKKAPTNFVVKTMLTILVFFTSFVFMTIMMFITGFLILQCSFAPFWDAIEPAHELHALIKNHKHTNGTYPENEDQLRKLSPDLYKSISDNAKQTYLYDHESESYTWFVRPSRHYVVIFDSKSDYVIYSIPQLITPSHWDQTPNYPPSYPGPWDQMPK